jgi:DNA-binding NarL/FixJ family response regulator
MADCTILTITCDERFLQVLRGQLHDQFGGSSRMIVAASIDEACSLLPMAHPRLIVVHGARHGSPLEELNRLLWVTTVLARQVPVLVIADRYRTDQATTLYRMGVREYISRTHHADQFGRILDSYLRPSPASAPRTADATDDPAQTTKTWSSTALSVAAQVV